MGTLNPFHSAYNWDGALLSCLAYASSSGVICIFLLQVGADGLSLSSMIPFCDSFYLGHGWFDSFVAS